AGVAGAIEAHVPGCEVCCRALHEIAPDTFVGLLQAGAGEKPGETVALPQRGADRKTPELPPEFVDHPRYRVRELLGVGGMGVVYKAEHRLMERTVALKVINPELTAQPQFVDRFLREFRAAGRLQHPNIVAAYDADKAGDRHFLVMEYVEGISLSRYVEKRGPLPVGLACHFMRQTALGLQHAFEQGMVHRDIKPHNLMVTRKGQIKILDFGLARFAHESGPESRPAGNTRRRAATLTMTGT